ncbi:hypothetical protein [Actinomadura sp. 7K507]|uniref:hypothetical protein n=1 Tax=Actinomadura sp. 7K507 TaxID=2530365 RepID=UPI0014044D3E|nr:hypothetical protein [Actinomadura sp. 7K507]
MRPVRWEHRGAAGPQIDDDVDLPVHLMGVLDVVITPVDRDHQVMLVDEPGAARVPVRRDVGFVQFAGVPDEVLEREDRDDLTVRVSMHPDVLVTTRLPRADHDGPAGRHVAYGAAFPGTVELLDGEPAGGHPSVMPGGTAVDFSCGEQDAPVRMDQCAPNSHDLHLRTRQDGTRRRVEDAPLVHVGVGVVCSPPEGPKGPHVAGVVVGDVHEGVARRSVRGMEVPLPHHSARGVDAADEATMHVVDGGAQLGGDVELPAPVVVPVLVPPGEGRLGDEPPTVRRTAAEIGRRQNQFVLPPSMNDHPQPLLTTGNGPSEPPGGADSLRPSAAVTLSGPRSSRNSSRPAGRTQAQRLRGV